MKTSSTHSNKEKKAKKKKDSKERKVKSLGKVKSNNKTTPTITKPKMSNFPGPPLTDASPTAVATPATISFPAAVTFPSVAAFPPSFVYPAAMAFAAAAAGVRFLPITAAAAAAAASTTAPTNTTTDAVSSSPVVISPKPDQTPKPVTQASLSKRKSKKDTSDDEEGADPWFKRYQELCEFRKANDHCLVPSNYKENLPLVQWVKRQRNQKKNKIRGEHTTLTDERERALDALGFVWDAHSLSWHERLTELLAYKRKNGHCNVPATYPQNPKLAIWVKCQRRQIKLWKKNEKKVSPTVVRRFAQLEAIGFDWNPRNLDCLNKK